MPIQPIKSYFFYVICINNDTDFHYDIWINFKFYAEYNSQYLFQSLSVFWRCIAIYLYVSVSSWMQAFPPCFHFRFQVSYPAEAADFKLLHGSFTPQNEADRSVVLYTTQNDRYELHRQHNTLCHGYQNKNINSQCYKHCGCERSLFFLINDPSVLGSRSLTKSIVLFHGVSFEWFKLSVHFAKVSNMTTVNHVLARSNCATTLSLSDDKIGYFAI